MSEITFKKFHDFVSQDEVSDEQITEIFGLFKNNDKLEKLKAEREKLKGTRDAKNKEIDQKIKDAKAGKLPPKPGVISNADYDLAFSSTDRKFIAKNDNRSDTHRDREIKEAKTMKVKEPGWYVVDHMDHAVEGPFNEYHSKVRAAELSGEVTGDIPKFDSTYFSDYDIRRANEDVVVEETGAEIVGYELTKDQDLVVIASGLGCKLRLKVKSLKGAADALRDFCDEEDLGSRSFNHDAKVLKGGKKIANISYSGRVYGLPMKESVQIGEGADAQFCIVKTRHRDNRVNKQEGTLAELIKAFSYTLETGAAYSHEKGNKKIDQQPKTVKSLISNLNAAVNNSAANGYAGISFELGTCSMKESLIFAIVSQEQFTILAECLNASEITDQLFEMADEEQRDALMTMSYEQVVALVQEAVSSEDGTDTNLSKLSDFENAGIKITEKPQSWQDYEDGGYAEKRNIRRAALRSVEKTLGKVKMYTGKELFGSKPSGPLVKPLFMPKEGTFIVSFSDGTKYLCDLTGAKTYIRNWQKIV